jgi:hypothetical protein
MIDRPGPERISEPVHEVTGGGDYVRQTKSVDIGTRGRR